MGGSAFFSAFPAPELAYFSHAWATVLLRHYACAEIMQYLFRQSSIFTPCFSFGYGHGHIGMVGPQWTNL